LICFGWRSSDCRWWYSAWSCCCYCRYGVGVPEAVTVEVGIKIRRVCPGGERYDTVAVGSTAVGDKVQHEDTGLQEGTTYEEAALPVVKPELVGEGVALQVFVVGDGDDDVAVEPFLLLHEASRGAHVLTTAAVQEPGVSSGWFGVGDRSVRRIDLKSL
ncbi:hypothetical protein CLOM_g23960, partial [Closterium sp. NIES-68]